MRKSIPDRELIAAFKLVGVHVGGARHAVVIAVADCFEVGYLDRTAAALQVLDDDEPPGAVQRDHAYASVPVGHRCIALLVLHCPVVSSGAVEVMQLAVRLVRSGVLNKRGGVQEVRILRRLNQRRDLAGCVGSAAQ